MTNDTILALSEIQTYMAQHHILQGITFNVKSGRVTTLLGRNGAGKSSTLKTIMGLYPPQAGEITFAGEAIQGMEPYEVAQRGVGFVPEDQAIFYHLTVEENMTLAMLDDNPKTQERCDRMLNLFPDLKKYWKSKGGVLSGGQRQMLAIARSMVNDNKLLLIDEPSKGLAPILVDAIIEAFNELKKTETIILVEQNFHMATSCGDDYHIIDDGRVVNSGLIEDLESNEELKQKFLGIG
ncbi:MAG: ABC transporter ATP-binding protein [Deltaproteobacteria bacterium]|nr:ABC transporter ATP-binding protein [Deltaproteobacteria bacterium]MBT4268906.1 ABC transporter ATP-binding protein [Deltaproteobacteria bacterium]MBT4638144.1 ABC transporter ATP-binding protein [Deltaproteobacteria bacterium]MBT6503966.1 ABC transporter ATP-binding protein [Deltaproteobacteria bacterium]MBT7154303.1 ABC transporter ATP-binding protein [Deltaproteobacteria bacterium]